MGAHNLAPVEVEDGSINPLILKIYWFMIKISLYSLFSIWELILKPCEFFWCGVSTESRIKPGFITYGFSE